MKKVFTYLRFLFKIIRENLLPFPASSLLVVLGLTLPILGFVFYLLFVFIFLKEKYFPFLLIFLGLSFISGIFLAARIPEDLSDQNFRSRKREEVLVIEGCLLADSRFSSIGYRVCELKIYKSSEKDWIGKHVLVMGRYPQGFWGDRILIEKKSLAPSKRSEREDALLFIDDPSEWKLLNSFFLSPVRSWIKNKLEGFWESLSPEVGDFSRALFWGDRSYLLSSERELFTKLGLIHILALSGFHLGLWAVGIFFVVQLFTSRRTAERFLPFILLSYLLLVGFYPSLIRAWIFLLVWTFYRSRFWYLEPFSALCLTLILSLCWDPSLLSSLGFALSLLAFGAILTDRSGSFWCISLRIFLATSPVLLFFFPSVPLAGFLLTPFMGLLVVCFMVGGLLELAFYFLAPFLSPFIDSLLVAILTLMEGILTLALPYAFPVGKLTYASVLLGVLSFLFFRGWRKITGDLWQGGQREDAQN